MTRDEAYIKYYNVIQDLTYCAILSKLTPCNYHLAPLFS